MGNLDIVISLLLENGWEQDGRTPFQSFRLITTESYPLAGAVMNIGNRLRFKNGEWRVTVGKQTTFFYRPKVGTSYTDEGNRYMHTKDIDRIKDTLEELKKGDLIMETPDELKPYTADYTPDSWQNYSEPEYRQWVDLLLKRSQHRANLGKKIKDLSDAKNYLVMLIARLQELAAQQAIQKQKAIEAKAEAEAKEKEKKEKVKA